MRTPSGVSMTKVAWPTKVKRNSLRASAARRSAAGWNTGERTAIRPGQLTSVISGFDGAGAAPCARACVAPCVAAAKRSAARKDFTAMPRMRSPRTSPAGRIWHGARPPRHSPPAELRGRPAGGLSSVEVARPVRDRRDDQALRGLHDPAAIDAADRFDPAETGKARARHDLVDLAVAFDQHGTAGGAAHRPAGHDQRPRQALDSGDLLRPRLR